jgi:hypothetical protein
MKRSFSGLTALLIWCCACSFASGQKGQPCLAYEPSPVELTGTLRIVPKFGPPNYGENPESDQKLMIPILELSRRVDICGDSTSEINRDAFNGLREIQVLFPPGTEYNGFRDRAVVVAGTLSQAVMSHHFTPVVMVVKTIQRAGGKETPS